MTIDAIETATRDLDETRRLLEVVADLRRASPPRLRGSDALAVAGAAEALPAAEANRLLKELLAEARDPLPGPARRVYVTGSEPTTTLYRDLEARGLHVVGEGPAGHTGPNARAAFVAHEAAAAGADVVLAWIRTGRRRARLGRARTAPRARPSARRPRPPGRGADGRRHRGLLT